MDYFNPVKMDGSNPSTHNTSIRRPDDAEVAALKAKVKELQQHLAVIDAILIAADEQAADAKTPRR